MDKKEFRGVMADELRRMADLIEDNDMNLTNPPSMEFEYTPERPVHMMIEYHDPEMGLRTVEIR